MSATAAPELTIGRFARVAGVGVETIRYYQERGLLPVPPTASAFRYYPVDLVGRIRFVKRAQDLGFTLDEIAELLRLEDGGDRALIQSIAAQRLEQIALKVADLRRMQRVLKQLVDECEHTRLGLPCPIIGSLTRAGPRAGEGDVSDPQSRTRPQPYTVQRSIERRKPARSATTHT